MDEQIKLITKGAFEMECVCVEEYQDVKIGMRFDVLEICQDYYLLDSNKGWRIEVSNKYFDKCFKNLNMD